MTGAGWDPQPGPVAVLLHGRRHVDLLLTASALCRG